MNVPESTMQLEISPSLIEGPRANGRVPHARLGTGGGRSASAEADLRVFQTSCRAACPPPTRAREARRAVALRPRDSARCPGNFHPAPIVSENSTHGS
jgi:hypothetical protein